MSGSRAGKGKHGRSDTPHTARSGLGERAVSADGDVGLAVTGDGNEVVVEGDIVVGGTQEHHYHLPRQAGVTWPLRVGSVPLLASAFQPRAHLRTALDAARSPAATVASGHVLSGGGGVGKSQLAAACAHEAVADGTDLVLWAPAEDVLQVITLYAHAARLIGAPGADGNEMEADARAFVAWAATTTRSWMIVLDDVTDPDAVGPWWPSGPSGRVIATSRLQDPRLTGGGRTRIDVDLYTASEAIAYLRARLTTEASDHLLEDRAAAVGEALGRLPLALGHAAAYMINEDVTATEYLQRLADCSRRLEQVLPRWADTEHYGREVGAALLLSLAAARAAEPNGLAEPLLRVVALLDPAGQPGDLWTTTDLLSHVGRQSDTKSSPPKRWWQRAAPPRTPVTEDQARSALRVLHRYSLITHDSRTPLQQVRIHALTARAVRETTRPDVLSQATVAIASALIAIWPDPDQTQPELAAILRTNTESLHQHSQGLLWENENSVNVLYRAGRSLIDAGLNHAAHAYWQHTSAKAASVFGPDHLGTLTARSALGTTYMHLGRHREALAIQERLLADYERLCDPDHPSILNARNNVVVTYNALGRYHDAVQLQEQILADHERVNGSDHPSTLTVRHNLAHSYGGLGRYHDALALEEQVLADHERINGPDHPETLSARASLASAYSDLGRHGDALPLKEQVLADRGRLLGPNHPLTLDARANLSTVYMHLGRNHEALVLAKQVHAEQERTHGPDHPDTLRARINLGIAYTACGRHRDALPVETAVLADCERVHGPDHPVTLRARGHLATTYGHLSRPREALALEEQVLAGRERQLGPDHPDTHATRNNLAITYGRLGRHRDALQLWEQLVADLYRLLGPDHPHTLTAGNNLASTYKDLNRFQDALALEKRIAADRERVQGPNHSDTLFARNNLASTYAKLGQRQEARDLMQGVVEGLTHALGADHPHTVAARSSLARLSRRRKGK
ncbi:tetratricopeptide repeat protein [Streptomyces flavotricini]|uniref:Tetratricopeptide repeat protein n=1 Tax=Streptomyces flavotricini TaxID=66888 RepID=A0ABS8EHP1_9ACTN|nr:FxSxx-COOH system tetratricopeptide repeat protein [Streptomyces flavotricini]MCC0100661.1 tetratricopeptide repeat protein [Streptomyces flavotricini]